MTNFSTCPDILRQTSLDARLSILEHLEQDWDRIGKKNKGGSGQQSSGSWQVAYRAVLRPAPTVIPGLVQFSVDTQPTTQLLLRHPKPSNMRLFLSWLCWQVSLAQIHEGIPDQEMKVKDLIRGVSPALQRFANKALKEGMADFTQSMYLHLAQQPDLTNFVFSPLSIHSSLSMLFLGTTHGSNTSDEMAKALGVLNNRNFLKLAYHDIVQTYTSEQNFLYGNNFWVQNGFPLNRTFEKLVKDNMNSNVANLDFADADSVEKVNQWVSNMTGGKIDNLVDSFSADTTLFIANALYFNEKWEIPFLDKDPVTGNKLVGDFQKADSSFVTADFIEQKSSQIGYRLVNKTKLGIELVKIPYKNSLFEMQLIIPKNVREMKTLEGTMQLSNDQDLVASDPNFFNIFSEDNRIESPDFIEDVFLKMPTFKIKTDMNAAEPLQKLGVNRVRNCCTNQPRQPLFFNQVFSQNAELEGISNASISVSRIKHTSLVEVCHLLLPRPTSSFPGDKRGNRRSRRHRRRDCTLLGSIWRAEGHCC